MYEVASGQIINVDKLEVSYGQNVSDHLKYVFKESFGFKAVETHDCYLDLPPFIKRSKKMVFKAI